MQGPRTLIGALSAGLALCFFAACSFDGAGPGLTAPAPDGSLPPNDSAQDLPPAADGGDLFPWPDAIGEGMDADIIIPPDITVDLPFGVFLDEDFSHDQGPISFVQGDWSWDAGEGGHIRQTSLEEYGNYAVFIDTPAGAIGAETLLKINAIQGIPGVSEGAGLAFRVQSPTAPGGPPRMAFCFLRPDGNSLALVVSDGSAVDLAPTNSVFFNNNPGTNYRILGELVNESLYCELVGQGISVSARVGPGAGKVGLATFYADVTFYSLKVYQPL